VQSLVSDFDIMADMKVFNTLGRELQELTLIKPGHVSFYHCGPTVYWTQHIGNMRGMVMADLIRRSLKYAGHEVTYVRNYTDVGHLTGDNDGDADAGVDRMEKASQRENKSPEEIARFYTEQFEADIEALNILPATHSPAATQYISQMIEMVQELLDKKFAYQTGLAIYFDISKANDYYALSGQSVDDLQTDAGHGDVHDDNKKNQTDFAIWFFKTGSHAQALQTWKNPFSETEGFPGWHIECSAMAKKLLGDTIDIHMGGIEHVPIHHTNEIAQSEAANGTTFANYWLHNEHLLVDSKKMSKSEGTSYSLRDIIDRGYSPLDLRYFFLQAHYRSKQNFTWDALEAAQTARVRLHNRIQKMSDGGSVFETFTSSFAETVYQDFNLPGALALVADVLKSDLSDADKRATILNFDQVFGLDLDTIIETVSEDVPQDVIDLVEQRKNARENKDWGESDRLRDEIDSAGYAVKDGPDGQEISIK